MAGNHPCEKKPANRDEIPGPEIISGRRNLKIRMKSAAGNHPCYEVTIVKRRLQEISVSGKPHLYFSDSVWKEL